eukprot:gene12282-2240_t
MTKVGTSIAQAATPPVVRVLLAGDTGVGKTSLATLLATGQAPAKPRPTVGCSIQVHVLESRDGSNPVQVEYMDVGGNMKFHAGARAPFYHNVQGASRNDISTLDNLKLWHAEIFSAILRRDFSTGMTGVGTPMTGNSPLSSSSRDSSSAAGHRNSISNP